MVVISVAAESVASIPAAVEVTVILVAAAAAATTTTTTVAAEVEIVIVVAVVAADVINFKLWRKGVRAALSIYLSICLFV